ncbi:MAG TPA: zinc ABC transporter substrate-binding protein [Opitutaceae bacterium]|nr:zinc ABC transporter substrate-binding protein [Opitutaceae bacterium]
MRPLLASVLFLFASALGLAAAIPTRGPLVVTANTILDDLVRQVGGDQVRTHCLVQPGADPHAFEPRPSDVKQLVSADVLVVNGLGLEPAILKLAQNCGFRGEILVAATGLTPRVGSGHHHHGKDAEDEDHEHSEIPSSSSASSLSIPSPSSTPSTASGSSTPTPPSAASENRKSETENSADPHAWQNPLLVATYVANIRDALARAYPAAANRYAERTAAYVEQLTALDRWAREQIATIPPARRKLVTSHDSLGYFADAYGFETVPVAGISSSAEPEARAVAAIVDLIRREQVPAVFFELTTNPKLLRQIGADAGVRLAEPLFTDSLGTPDSGADTYLGLIRANVTRIVAALR